MPEKLSNGDYRCKHCEKIIERFKQAKIHEGFCAENRLSEYMGDEVGKMIDLDIPENNKTDSKQLTLNQNLVGSCFNCGEKLTTSDRMKPDSSLFECTVCGNISRIEV